MFVTDIRYILCTQAESLEIHHLNAVCLKSFLKVTGPIIDQTEGLVLWLGG